MGVKLLLTPIAIIILWQINVNVLETLELPMSIAVALISCAFAFFLPNIWLSKTRQRQTAIEQPLPDAMDLLVTCVEAGLSLDAAMARVAQEMEMVAPILAHEMKQTMLEIQAGVRRADAFHRLAHRTGVGDLRALSAMIIQTELFGTSVARALRVHAEGMRVKRMQRAEEKAAMVSVKMTVPLIFFILPSLMVVVMGPAALMLILGASSDDKDPPSADARAPRPLRRLRCSGVDRRVRRLRDLQPGNQGADPHPNLARMKMAEELVSRGDWQEAFGLLSELHQQRPADPEVLTLRGIVYRERGLFSDAENDLRAALKVAPASPEAHAALGILFDMQMRPGAEAEHREAVRLAPNNPVYLNNLGFSLFLREHFKEAIREYEKAARMAPLSHRVRTNMGYAYAALGDLPSAAREFRMGGSEVDADNNLGFAYERRGDMANAYDLYLQAVRLNPTAVRPRSNLIHAAMLGRPVPAEVPPPPASRRPRRCRLCPALSKEPVRPLTRTTTMTTKNGSNEERARRWLVVVALLGFSTLAGACDRTHLSPSYGQSFNAWFAMQHVRSAPADTEPTRRALTSLDSQEAAAISKNYRRTVGGQGEGQVQGQMVMIGQAHNGARILHAAPLGSQGQ